ncbi:YbaB/EbfC family nucleoid-associated protein [Actinoplanes teichomyceticus]|uniref:YbaB/EbfC DNA-binding family protein n=1 Tax=Actinoplanes teichomyceticus TaxID=1867 RepID=A0A561WB40_ACTTI|nr:YbaB/EbfC family nucleoid-associated protein [Actinoplanes teichomyceticus]TWG21087.1 YbaB/EbfC DNA-binding family protein [Actinoplanes teichomyceticus]GIF14906.1 hypothetical protein Ate01nite_49380 [Actinoplanes teichomyceticus]
MASDAEPLLEPGMALDRLAAWQHDIDQVVARTRAATARLAALRVSASDPRGLVRVTLDAQGTLHDIRFTARLDHYDPDVVSRTIMAAVRDARRRAAGDSALVIEETLGSASVAARELTARVAERLRTSPEDRP